MFKDYVRNLLKTTHKEISRWKKRDMKNSSLQRWKQLSYHFTTHKTGENNFVLGKIIRAQLFQIVLIAGIYLQNLRRKMIYLIR